MSTIVKTRGLTKYFGSLVALDSVDIHCSHGITAILGPNGAGKTTLIRILLGLTRASSGSAEILGKDSGSSAEQIHQELGVLHEKPTFPRNFTAKQFLRLVCGFYGLDDMAQRVADSLRIVELSEREDQKIGTFSAGMTQRLGMAQALISNPRLVILDEPMANLDPIGRVHILNVIRDVWKNSGTSFLLLSHDLYYLERVCTHAIFIKAGRVVCSGAVQDLIRHIKGTYITLVCNKAETAYKAIKSLESVQTAEKKGDEIECTVDNLSNFQSEFFELALQKGLLIRSLQVQRDKLEQLYFRLIGDRERN